MKIIKNSTIIIGFSLIVSVFHPLFTYAKTNDSFASINKEDNGIDIGVDITQNQKTTYSEEIEEGSTQSADVYVSQASTFGVKIPKVIILDGVKNEENVNKANYVVSISNSTNIGGKEKIKVVPDASFVMSQVGKEDIIVTVTQDKDEWKHNELNILGNGEVSTNEMSAGMWKGKFNFNIKLETNISIQVEAFDENGNDLNANASLIQGNKKEELLTSLLQTGYIFSTNEVDLLINVECDDFENMATTTFDVNSIAKENDKVVILHFNEITNEWEYISTEVVNSEGKITTNMSSFSPIAFVKLDSNGNLENINLEAGVYCTNGTFVDWNTLTNTYKMDIEQNYTSLYQAINNFKTCTTSPYYVFDKYKLDGKVIIPKGVSKIGNNCFYYIKNITFINIPETVNEIGQEVFSYTDNLNSIIINKNNTTYDSRNNCNAIIETSTNTLINGCKTSTIPYGVEKIGSFAFANTKVETITLPNTIKTIKNQAFFCCYDLSGELTIPNSVETIEVQGFSHCDNIIGLKLSDNIKSIGNYAFRYNKNMEYVLYKGIKYTSISELETILINNNVDLGTEVFVSTKLSN